MNANALSTTTYDQSLNELNTPRKFIVDNAKNVHNFVINNAFRKVF